jgi:hypothetical protein
MAGRTCSHCQAWIAAGTMHDCWTTTEAALTADLSDDLREAWERLRATLAELGEQRIYASHQSIMFSRKACYCFVRPKRTTLEVVTFLGREIRSPQIRRTERASKAKFAHFVHVRHRDEVESPLTDWLREAYELPDRLASRGTPRARPSARARPPAAPAQRKSRSTRRAAK